MKLPCRCILVCIVLQALLASPTVAQPADRYEQLIQAPATSSTVISYANALLVLPIERESVEHQLLQRWWASNPELTLSDEQRSLHTSELRNQLDTVQEIVVDNQLTELVLAGFTQVGTVQNLDLYYAANSPRGPIIFRVSTSFRPDDPPLLHDIQTFVGFEQAREVAKEMQYVAGNRTARVSVTGDSAAPPSGEESGS